MSLMDCRIVHRAHRDRLMARGDVVAVGVGLRTRNGESTGQPVIKVMVARKVAPHLLHPAARLPPTLRLGGLEVEVDVDELSPPSVPPRPGPIAPPRPADPHLVTEARPIAGGFSIAHYNFDIGTVAVGVLDRIEGRHCLLSCNHVLARLNQGHFADAALQPAKVDGGIYPMEAVAGLLRYVPIHFDGTPNYVDAAIAACWPGDVSNEVHGIGPITESAEPWTLSPGDTVTKVGRSTGLTTGKVVMTDTSVNPNYKPLGFDDPTAIFHDQIVVSIHAEYGDSGSLLLDSDKRAVGMLFGGIKYSWFNPFTEIERRLQVRLLPPRHVWV